MIAPPPIAAAARCLMKGNEAIAEAAIQAGCDAYFGYPITPQAELLEWMARRMPELGRVFVQAESELGAINMALGAAATGARVLVSSSSPGISLMAEAMSYMAGSELPVVLVNVMRGGPGLGSIGPSQSDYFQATKGHGHGDYRVPVLAPSSIAEAVELVADAFEIAERYRTPTMLLADGVMGQAMEPVVPTYRTPARLARRLAADRGGRSAAAGRPLAAPPAGGPRGPRPAPPGEVRDDRRARGPLGRRGARRRRDRDRRLRHVGAGRPDGDRAGPRRRSGARPVPADHAVAVPGRGPRGDRRPRPGDPRRRAVGRPDASRTSGSPSATGRRSCSTAGRAGWSRPRARSSRRARRAWATTEPRDASAGSRR